MMAADLFSVIHLLRKIQNRDHPVVRAKQIDKVSMAEYIILYLEPKMIKEAIIVLHELFGHAPKKTWDVDDRIH